MNEFRVGKVSAVDYAHGMVSVYYSDKQDTTTEFFPVLNFGGVYKMPHVDDMVVVAHLSNGSSKGIVLGTIWNLINIPQQTGSNIFHMDLSNDGSAFISYNYATGEMKIKAPTITIIEG